ncbi:hypothetical protein [Desulfovibrio psychrotolerans]|uniref:Uncharacterized protein n=1 Tax=Desulfovibrio psychrotolerans TaxID=415242 RepID=A0A7J0BSH1_9BACT|nr:hypothetical protein [Desulfovibrio psychrotolerans]GFM36122.1 hypothetical protein DSM19430T_08060 [Desulfovibrio psychrotolerans]
MNAGRHGNGHGRRFETAGYERGNQCGKGRYRGDLTEDGQENRLRRNNRFGSDVLMENPATDDAAPAQAAGMTRGGFGRGLRLRDGSCRRRVGTAPERPEE